MTRIDGFAVALGIALAASAFGARADAAFQTLYAFNVADGDHPQSGLVLDAQGNLYGTAPLGGSANLGVVFRLAPDGTFTLLHQFIGGRDGAAPTPAALTLAANGTLYGTTVSGGRANGGTVYSVKPNGKTKVLHSFGIGNDGYWPGAGVLLGDDGSLTGTTQLGGSGCAQTNGCGTVYRLARDGSESVLHVFTGGAIDGSGPTGTLARDRVGNLFGVTRLGGSVNKGTVFEIAPDGSESVFHSFANGSNSPYEALVIDKHGTIYGTTEESNNRSAGGLFKIDSDGKAKVIHQFGNTDGYGVGLPALVRDGAGNLYGTTSVGGGNQTGDCHFAGGCGTMFMIAPDGTETILHAFGGSDGQYPNGGVITDGHGNFYGTTMWGGAYAHGTIYKISTGAK